MSSPERQHEAFGHIEPAVEDERQSRAFFLVVELAVQRIDIGRQQAFAANIMPGVFIGRPDRLVAKPELPRQRRHEDIGFLRPVAVVAILMREEFAIGPDRMSVAPPIGGQRPARQAFARIPFALTEVQQPAGREAPHQSVHQIGRDGAFRRSRRRRVPLRAIHIVDGNECRLAAHCQPNVVRNEFAVDHLPHRVDGAPLHRRIGLRRARLLVDARDKHLVAESDLTRVDTATDRRRARSIRRAGKRDMSFAREQSRCRIKPDPARAR